MHTQTEHLRQAETTIDARPQREHSETLLTQNNAKRAIAHRNEMLSRLAAVVDARTYEMLAKKVQREEETLNQFLAADAKTIEARRKSKKILDSEYFVQKSLDARAF